MKEHKHYEVIIIGGSYAGLSAAMALGRSMRSVLIIDSGKPCNRQTPHSHNFITQDGQKPSEIANNAKAQVLKYDSVTFHQGLAMAGKKTLEGFEIETQSGDLFSARKLIFATGLKDLMPDIKGFAECWGISILHCPYCHGYEVKNEKTGILANGFEAFHYAQLITNWTKELTLFTNGKSTLTEEQTVQIRKNNLEIIEKEIDFIEHSQGKIQRVVFKDGAGISVNALYASPAFVQHSQIPEALGCQFTDEGLLEVDGLQQTTVEGVYACGDNSSRRAVSIAVSTGTLAGIASNHSLIEEEFFVK
ncbi:NAD(P)/FAD-dependent oxidoreductase [Fulvivirgaceae bacterium BMA10]|uniref:NAD(P)/FAD-dependent oxidoreductase n=1 Tax=Splendidivirga corallicola TaxID=3051826 RepID=A0ABT8KML6_9BACT|nr:NAD(P)/FAD-dependent oxidoreductase [Fulvivirgaceae bacterium BMA10]